jgi:hypothetical protein
MKSRPDINETLVEKGVEAALARHDHAEKYEPPKGNGRRPQPEAATVPATTLDQVVITFKKWLALTDLTPVYAALGAVAANLLDGDPVWLGLIAPPSSAKTEILNAFSRLACVVAVATVTAPALLSGTPKKQRDKGAQGGLLRKVGEFGILVLKDFGSILSMRPDTQAAILAALREVYDGSWTRHLGTDGGKALTWRGKLGFLFGATEAYDSHYAVIGSLGDRFLLCRLEPCSDAQFTMALKHTGDATKMMRVELADAVAGLFVKPLPAPQPLADQEMERLKRVVMLAIQLRAGVERDRYSREIEAVYGAEGPGRIALTLERLLAGLTAIGVQRENAMSIVEKVAMDSTPPIRRQAFETLTMAWLTTRDIANMMGLPTTTARRALEELAAHGLAVRQRGKKGDGKDKEAGPDQWGLAEEWENWRRN